MKKFNLHRPKGYEHYNFPCIIQKPWGFERWLELWYDPKIRRGYCMKYLFIKKGTKTSLQIHKIKTETNLLIKGKLRALFKDEKGKMRKKIMKAGNPKKDTWTIPAGIVHRIYALTDVYLVETSTHDVDDITRLEDIYERGNGKIESEHKT
ncbi:MAG: cupin domain-containing protein [Nanoarchaeota archaeon]